MKLTVRHGGIEKTQEFSEEILLWDALRQMGYEIKRPCAGRGICGNCEVTANGEPVRTCITCLEEDTIVEDLPISEAVQVMTDGRGMADLGEALVEYGYGLSVDIGTTTMAGYLYHFPEGRLVKTFGELNPQTKYGADVMTRMEYVMQHGIMEMQRDVCQVIESWKKDYYVEKMVVTGNTAMLHFLVGKDTGGMSTAPYSPQTLFGEWNGDMYLPECISAFVGGDITCAVLASGMLEKRTAILVDIGTNGEMVLWKNGRLLCCSAPAGPAFEGAEISMGMLAEAGAIHRVYVENGDVKYDVIGTAKPKGICGSGLIDAVAVMLKMGILDDTGYLEECFEISGSGVAITPEDIRQVQLAKAAIRAGIETLLYESDCSYDDIECFYVAGGFGSCVNKESAADIGLLPRQLSEKVECIGNAAGAGATMILQNRESLVKSERIAELAEVLQLADSAYFAEEYIEQMMFTTE